MSASMSVSEARKVLIDGWFSIPEERFQRAICTLMESKSGDAWMRDHPEVLRDPADEVDPKSLGVHQRAEWFAERHRLLLLTGKVLYFRSSDIEALVS